MNDKKTISNFHAEKAAYRAIAKELKQYVETNRISHDLAKEGYNYEDSFFIITAIEGIQKAMAEKGYESQRPTLTGEEENRLKIQVEANRQLSAMWESPTLREMMKAEFWMQERMKELKVPFAEFTLIVQAMRAHWDEGLSDVDAFWDKVVKVVEKYRLGENPSKEFIAQLYGKIGMQYFNLDGAEGGSP